jgi:ATP:corrinoid adenosyltransferase
MKMADHRLDPFVRQDIFRAAASGAIDRVIFLQLLLSLGEGLVDREEVAKLLGLGLIALEIVQRGLDAIARLLVRAHDVHRMTDRFHRLLRDEDLVFFDELAGQHEKFFA